MSSRYQMLQNVRLGRARPSVIQGAGAARKFRLITWGGCPNARRKARRMRSRSAKPVCRATTSIGCRPCSIMSRGRYARHQVNQCDGDNRAQIVCQGTAYTACGKLRLICTATDRQDGCPLILIVALHSSASSIDCRARAGKNCTALAPPTKGVPSGTKVSAPADVWPGRDFFSPSALRTMPWRNTRGLPGSVRQAKLRA
jgi:hypothetical protein